MNALEIAEKLCERLGRATGMKLDPEESQKYAKYLGLQTKAPGYEFPRGENTIARTAGSGALVWHVSMANLSMANQSPTWPSTLCRGISS